MDALPWFIAAGVALLAAAQVLPLWRARRMRGTAPPLDDLLTAQQRRAARLLVYFWSPRCAMCRSMTPFVQSLASGRDDVLAVDVSRDLALARRLRVMATPTVVVLEAGRVAKTLLGARSEREIRALLG